MGQPGIASARARFSRDGRQFAFTVNDTRFEPVLYQVIETTTGRLIADVGHSDERVTDGVFHADGKQFLLSSP